MKVLVITFEELFKKHYSSVVSYIMRTVKNQQVAEDLAQEVFLQLYRVNWQEIEHLNAWLKKSAIYVAYNYLRSEKRHQARVEKESMYLEAPRLEPLYEACVRKEEIEKVRHLMDGLKEQDKKLLMLRYSGLKYKEIAEILEVETSAIGTMLVRAQQKFKKLYTKNMEVKL